MTKKERQAMINDKVVNALELWTEGNVVRTTRLNRCKASRVELDNNCMALLSYGTLVALFDEVNGEFYDALRYTYGYTSTSARHIAKFRGLLRPLITTEYRYYSI